MSKSVEIKITLDDSKIEANKTAIEHFLAQWREEFDPSSVLEEIYDGANGSTLHEAINNRVCEFLDSIGSTGEEESYIGGFDANNLVETDVNIFYNDGFDSVLESVKKEFGNANGENITVNWNEVGRVIDYRLVEELLAYSGKESAQIEIRSENYEEIELAKLNELIADPDSWKDINNQRQFMAHDATNNNWIGVDNCAGDCFVEEFSNKRDCVFWLSEGGSTKQTLIEEGLIKNDSPASLSSEAKDAREASAEMNQGSDIPHPAPEL